MYKKSKEMKLEEFKKLLSETGLENALVVLFEMLNNHLEYHKRQEKIENISRLIVTIFVIIGSIIIFFMKSHFLLDI